MKGVIKPLNQSPITLEEAQRHWNGSGRHLAISTGKIKKQERNSEHWTNVTPPVLITNHYKITFERNGSNLKATVTKVN